MGGDLDRQPVPQFVEDGREHLPGELFVRPEVIADLIEPDVGCFERPVEHLEAVRAHASSPALIRFPRPLARTRALERAFHTATIRSGGPPQRPPSYAERP